MLHFMEDARFKKYRDSTHSSISCFWWGLERSFKRAEEVISLGQRGQNLCQLGSVWSLVFEQHALFAVAGVNVFPMITSGLVILYSGIGGPCVGDSLYVHVCWDLDEYYMVSCLSLSGRDSGAVEWLNSHTRVKGGDKDGRWSKAIERCRGKAQVIWGVCVSPVRVSPGLQWRVEIDRLSLVCFGPLSCSWPKSRNPDTCLLQEIPNSPPSYPCKVKEGQISAFQLALKQET